MEPYDYAHGADQAVSVIKTLEFGGNLELSDFGRKLIKKYGSIVREAIDGAEYLSNDDLLLEIIRWLIEEDLLDTLLQLLRKGITKKEFSAHCSSIWGAIFVHVEIFLLMPFGQTPPLVTLKKGWYITSSELHSSYKFQDPISVSRIKSLISTLGFSWLVRYLETYTLNKKIPELFKLLISNGKSEALHKWMEQRTTRTMERARRAFLNRLWEKQFDEKDETPQANLPALLNRKPSGWFERLKASQLNTKPGDDTTNDFVEYYSDRLSNTLPARMVTPLIVPDLLSEDADGNRCPVQFDDLCRFQGLCLLVGLPGSGKTTLQSYIAHKMIAERRGIHLFVDLVRFARSGFVSLFEYAADQLIREYEVPLTFQELRIKLIDFERQGVVYWYLENWERLADNERRSCLGTFISLSNVLLSVVNQFEMIEQIREIEQEKSVTFFHILPLSEEKKQQFIEAYVSQNPEVDRSKIRELVKLLPGLSSIPSGLRYIVENYCGSVIDVLLGYLDAHQIAFGNPPLKLSVKQTRGMVSIDWGNIYISKAYEIVTALIRRGPVREYNVDNLNQINSIVLGAGLQTIHGSMNFRIQRSQYYLDSCCYAELLCLINRTTYSFVIPEIGYLLAAMAVFETISLDSRRRLANTYQASTFSDISLVILNEVFKWLEQLISLPHRKSS